MIEEMTFTINGRGMWIPGYVMAIKHIGGSTVSFGDNGNMSFHDGIHIHPDQTFTFSPAIRRMRVRTLCKCKAIINCVFMSKEQEDG